MEKKIKNEMNLAVSGNLFRAKCKCQELFNNDETETETNRTTSQGKTASTAFLFSVEETLTQVPGEAKWPPRGTPDHVARPPRQKTTFHEGGGNKREVRTTHGPWLATRRNDGLIWYAGSTVRVSPSIPFIYPRVRVITSIRPLFRNRFIVFVSMREFCMHAHLQMNISQPSVLDERNVLDERKTDRGSNIKQHLQLQCVQTRNQVMTAYQVGQTPHIEILPPGSDSARRCRGLKVCSR